MRHRTIFFSVNIIFLLFIFGYAFESAADKKNDVYSTWEGFEVDKCAAIWLIQRFVNTEAKIKFFPKGQAIDKGIPFDTPDAELRRYHNMSTYESILKRYNIRNSKLIHIGKIVHDIEINIWERKRFEESNRIQDSFNTLILKIKDREELIEKTNRLFDEIYKKLEK